MSENQQFQPVQAAATETPSTQEVERPPQERLGDGWGCGDRDWPMDQF